MTQDLIIHRLHTYTDFTISQFLKLGYSKSIKTLRKELKLLIEKGVIDKHSYKNSPKLGKLEDAYCLNSTCRTYLESLIEKEAKMQLKKRPLRLLNHTN